MGVGENEVRAGGGAAPASPGAGAPPGRGVPPVRVGWLRKKSPKGYIGARPWQARYFVLR